MSRVPVAWSPIRPRALSLLTAARAANDGVRWFDGLITPREDCGNARAYMDCVPDPAAGTGAGAVVQFDNGTDPSRPYDPFAVQTSLRCSTGTTAWAYEELRPRALEQLEWVTALSVERELWTGELAREAGSPNRSLANAATTTVIGASTGAGVSPLAAMGLLEQALGTTPGDAFLHADLLAASFMARESIITGNLMRARTGAVIVPGAGYPGTGPDGTAAPTGTAWVYGTGPVTVRLTPGELVGDAPSSLDRNVDTVEVIAERLAAVTYAGCETFAVLMALHSD